jgi:tetratricopeptide (TPR) repeat protein
MNATPSPEEALLALALTKPAEKRTAFLNALCEGDAALRQRLDSLLAAQEQPETQLATKAGAQQGAFLPETAEEPADEAVGQMLGRYKLLERVGEGGCGVVYVAEQTEPVHRRVALKVIKLGMDTKQVVARFEAERQALAMMDHPNIAKVLDAGATDVGRPYFVMELVRGLKITDYCDQVSLSTQGRLDLFIKVCHAIQHAHQKGIIHRDIKPSNILVTLHDSVPVPKVIDFGIAKATEGRLTDHTVYTQLHQFIGTPAYMSPEQAEMSGLDIDTRSDIYSLGVLLYELLAGSPPFDPKELMASGIDGMRRTIREKEPPRPSTRLATLGADQLTTTAKRRSADTSKLLHQLQGDLDWVVMKCLEKDRQRRYETANGLAADLKRHLNNEPVSARPAGLGYKTQKFIRRNRGAVAAAGTILTLLVVGIVVTSRLAVEATRARNEAAREAVRSAEVAQFLKDMLAGAGPARARGRDTAMLREILDTAAQRVGQRLKNQPDVQSELSALIGRTYLALGEYAEAEKQQRAALDLTRQLHGPSHTNLVLLMGELGGLLGDVGHLPEATNLLHQSVAMSVGLVGEDHPLSAEAMRRLGVIQADLGKYAEAEQLLVPASQTLLRRLGPDDPQTLRCRQNLAALYYRQQKLAQMEPVALANLDAARQALGEDDPLTLNIGVMVALLRQSQGRFDEAESRHAEILATKRRILGKDHPSTLLSMDYLGLVYSAQGRFAEAEALARAALDIAVRSGRDPGGIQLSLRNNRAEYLRNLGRHAEAEAELRQVIELATQASTPTDPMVLEMQRALALTLEFQGRQAEAETLLHEIVRIRRAELPPKDPDLADTLAHLARVLLAAGKPSEAEMLAQESLAALDTLNRDDWRRFGLESLLGACHSAAGNPASAEPLLLRGYEGLAEHAPEIPAIEHLRIREALQRLVSHFSQLNRPAESAHWQTQFDRFEQSPAGQRLTVARTSRPAP